MAKSKTVFICRQCSHVAHKWIGQCPDCEEWNSHDEERSDRVSASHVLVGEAPRLIAEVTFDGYSAAPTGIAELDRVLGGGFVAGSVTLVGGEPGIGKSTLLLQAVAALAASGKTCLYVAAEESSEQVRLRAERLDAVVDNLWLVSETSLPAVLAHCDQLKPDYVVIDSIQTLLDPNLSSAPGSVGQVRHCAHRLVNEAKRRCMSTILVGHVTKEGGLAGPRALEHVVDTVLAFEGDRHHALRLLRAVKHRFGATDELGVFEMAGSGLESVSDPSRLFLADRAKGVAGSIVVPVLDGHRPLLVEVQALVAQSNLASPRRSAQGVDSGRLSLIIAVLERRSQIGFAKTDVFTSAIGGVKITEPAADLGMALALASSVTGHPLESGLVACGEIGLAGELRQSAQTERRLIEAARVGFTKAVIPAGAPPTPDGILGLRAETISEALHLTGMTGQHSGFNQSPPRRGAPSGPVPSLDNLDDVDWTVVRPLHPPRHQGQP
ncbi:MAG: DNA repair protein RadA/Sms [Verrucomicrobiales bacterium]|jgi:DNA repair protein RadA/Sms